MKNEAVALQEIHKIREEIYEETKNMSPAERTKHASEMAKKIIRKYDLKIEYENRIMATQR